MSRPAQNSGDNRTLLQTNEGGSAVVKERHCIREQACCKTRFFDGATLVRQGRSTVPDLLNWLRKLYPVVIGAG
jgi:hypothetical protein